MSQPVHCPECNRQLRVPDNLLGKRVKCPKCGNAFTAVLPPAKDEEPDFEVVDEEPPPKKSGRQTERQPDEEYQEEPVRRRSRPAPLPEEDEAPAEEYQERPRPRRQRRALTPHRGTMILVLGILSLVICGWIGPFAWVMGNRDLEEIRRGRMDREGQGITNAGRICGIIGTVFGVLQCCYVGIVALGLILPALQKARGG